MYPASGPLPKSNAPYYDMASWGQGDQGAAGYEESGQSELVTIPPAKVSNRNSSRTAKSRSKRRTRRK